MKYIGMILVLAGMLCFETVYTVKLEGKSLFCWAVSIALAIILECKHCVYSYIVTMMCASTACGRIGHEYLVNWCPWLDLMTWPIGLAF